MVLVSYTAASSSVAKCRSEFYLDLHQISHSHRYQFPKYKWRKVEPPLTNLAQQDSTWWWLRLCLKVKLLIKFFSCKEVTSGSASNVTVLDNSSLTMPDFLYIILWEINLNVARPSIFQCQRKLQQISGSTPTLNGFWVPPWPRATSSFCAILLNNRQTLKTQPPKSQQSPQIQSSCTKVHTLIDITSLNMLDFHDLWIIPWGEGGNDGKALLYIRMLKKMKKKVPGSNPWSGSKMLWVVPSHIPNPSNKFLW